MTPSRPRWLQLNTHTLVAGTTDRLLPALEPGGPRRWLAGGRLPAVSPCTCVLTGRERTFVSLPLLRRGTDHTARPHPRDFEPSHLPKAPPPPAINQGLGLQHGFPRDSASLSWSCPAMWPLRVTFISENFLVPPSRRTLQTAGSPRVLPAEQVCLYFPVPTSHRGTQVLGAEVTVAFYGSSEKRGISEGRSEPTRSGAWPEPRGGAQVCEERCGASPAQKLPSRSHETKAPRQLPESQPLRHVLRRARDPRRDASGLLRAQAGAMRRVGS